LFVIIKLFSFEWNYQIPRFSGIIGNSPMDLFYVCNSNEIYLFRFENVQQMKQVRGITFAINCDKAQFTNFNILCKMEKKIPQEDNRSSKAVLVKTRFLIDGITDKPLTNVDLYIVDGIITKVRDRFTITQLQMGTNLEKDIANSPHEVIDLTEYTVLPGLIDSHCHPCTINYS
jgi:hypothetical protein